MRCMRAHISSAPWQGRRRQACRIVRARQVPIIQLSELSPGLLARVPDASPGSGSFWLAASHRRIGTKSYKAERTGLSALAGVFDMAVGGRGEASDAALLEPSNDLEGQGELTLNERVRGPRRD